MENPILPWPAGEENSQLRRRGRWAAGWDRDGRQRVCRRKVDSRARCPIVPI